MDTRIEHYRNRNIEAYAKLIADEIYKYRDCVSQLKDLSDQQLDNLFKQFDKYNDIAIETDQDSELDYQGIKYDLHFMEVELGVYVPSDSNGMQRIDYELNTYGLFRNGYRYSAVFIKKINNHAQQEVFDYDVPENVIQQMIENGHFVDTWR